MGTSTSDGDLSLCNPEWQGYGEHADVHYGALAIARTLFDPSEFLFVACPADEPPTLHAGVCRIASIAPRCRTTLDDLRRRAPARIFLIGGTCGVEIAPVACLAEQHGSDMAVVWMDAHGDLNTPDSSPSGHFHGMALRTLLGDGPASITSLLDCPLVPEQVFLAGTRDLDPAEAEYVQRAGITVTTPVEMDAPAVLVDRIAARGFGRVYIHLDLDVLDPHGFPDALMQTAGGVTPDAVSAAVRALASRFELVGFSVVEFCPRSEGALARLGSLLAGCGVDIGAMRRLRA